MKSLTKKLATLSLAGAIFGAASGLAGCNDEKTISDSDYFSAVGLSNVYIVVNENGIETLHKGDLIERAWAPIIYTSAAMTPILKFNCGKELQTYQFVAYPQGCPQKEKYDEVCDCAREATLSQD